VAISIAQGSQTSYPVRARRWWRSAHSGPVCRGSWGSVSVGRPTGRFSPRSGTCRWRHEPRFRLSSGPRPLALSCARLSANLGAFNPRPYTLTEIGDSFGGPPL